MNIEKIRVIIADDHDLYRDGLRLLLSMDGDIEVVAEASNGRDLIQFAREYKPDVIVTDLIMPGVSGIEAIQEICKAGTIRIIALSSFDSEHLIVEALESGAFGYILKNAQRGEVTEAIKTVYNYDPYYCKSTSSHLVRLISRSKFNPYTKKKQDLFSDEEKQVIRLICKEKSSEEISQILCKGKRSVDRMRAAILEKMNVKTSGGVVIYAIKNGIYSLEEEG